MTRTVYVNGCFVPESEAVISVFDRGFLMADAVYEVTAVLDGRLCDFSGHLARLQRSLGQLTITNPMNEAEWLALHRELVARNGLVEGLVYLQVTRGSAGDRDFLFPPAGTPPGVVLFTQDKPHLAANPIAEKGLRVITLEDLRWGRRDIKTVQLLSSALAKMQAKAAGADEAWLVENGLVTEGTSSNAHIVSGNRLVTRQLSNEILHGITRAAVLKLAAEAQLTVDERPFTIAEAQSADEAFVTSASSFVMPVVEVDGIAVGTGKVGPITLKLREIYIQAIRDASC